MKVSYEIFSLLVFLFQEDTVVDRMGRGSAEAAGPIRDRAGRFQRGMPWLR